MDGWQAEVDAKEKRRVRARELWETLYKEMEATDCNGDPVELAFEVYRRTTVKKDQPCLVVWATDPAKEVVRKIDGVKKTPNTHPTFDEKSEKVIIAVMEKMKSTCPKKVDGLHTTMELYLQVLTYENPDQTRNGFVVFRDSESTRIEECCKKWFKKSYIDIQKEAGAT